MQSLTSIFIVPSDFPSSNLFRRADQLNIESACQNKVVPSSRLRNGSTAMAGTGCLSPLPMRFNSPSNNRDMSVWKSPFLPRGGGKNGTSTDCIYRWNDIKVECPSSSQLIGFEVKVMWRSVCASLLSTCVLSIVYGSQEDAGVVICIFQGLCVELEWHKRWVWVATPH